MVAETPVTASTKTRTADTAIAISRTLAATVDEWQATNPALAAQVTGSLATYLKSGVAPVVGSFVGYGAAHLGLMCTAATIANSGCWSQGTIDLVTEILVMAGTGIGALIMHWHSKAPARAVLNESPK